MYISAALPQYPSRHHIQPGDWVRVWVPSLTVWHHGIVRRLVPTPTGFAVEIIHNNKASGGLTEWYAFGCDCPIQLYRRPVSLEHARLVIAKAESQMHQPYDLFAQNCEHFASWAFTGRAESGQLQKAVVLSRGAMVLGMMASE